MVLTEGIGATSPGNASKRKDVKVSIFVIIVVIPYLIALVIFFEPKSLYRLFHEWPWESRRVEQQPGDEGQTPA
jgi:hypothetical protein